MAVAAAAAGASHHDFLPQDIIPDSVSRLPPHAVGELAPQHPVLTPLERNFEILREGFRINAVAEFSMQSIILGRRRYYFDPLHVAPIDLVMGWGPMSNPAVLRTVRISLAGRDFSWDIRPPPRISSGEVAECSGTFHIIPARRALRDELLSLRRNHAVQISGFLCDLEAPDGSALSSVMPSRSGSQRKIAWIETVRIMPTI